MWAGQRSRYSDWLRAGRSGDRIPVGGEIFRTCPDRPWDPPNLLYDGYWVFPGGTERPGRDADPSPPFSAVGHERIELYLYSPYGPYGLYRASVPVQWCILPYLQVKIYHQYLVPTLQKTACLHQNAQTVDDVQGNNSSLIVIKRNT